MAESINSKMRRVSFPKGKQKQFLLQVQKKSGLSWRQVAQIGGVHIRTLADWKREKFTMSFDALARLSKKTKVPAPKNTTIKNPFWYAARGARAGGLAVYQKYGRIGGDPEVRRKRWKEWWSREGKLHPHPILIARSIKKPRLCAELAEFIGIVLGDGGITQDQISITLHYIDDLEYSKFVVLLVKKLFEIDASNLRRPNEHVVVIRISRTNLVKFCVALGLKIGNKVKQQVDMPQWIKDNLKYQIACLRGLVDTDGSVFRHRYKSNGKLYSYKKIDFTNRSIPLLTSVSNILKILGIKHRIAGNYKIRIEAQKDVERFFKLIGSHNPKHLKKYASVI
ncbi:MAG: LAGLIDADG family homing endonuclease [Candidatus Sungbacteria bacterium]|nr:LAGLIDADG family homing endonuclease [Candidatus Sungbacteria bacterium]